MTALRHRLRSWADEQLEGASEDHLFLDEEEIASYDSRLPGGMSFTNDDQMAAMEEEAQSTLLAGPWSDARHDYTLRAFVLQDGAIGVLRHATYRLDGEAFRIKSFVNEVAGFIDSDPGWSLEQNMSIGDTEAFVLENPVLGQRSIMWRQGVHSIQVVGPSDSPLLSVAEQMVSANS